MTSTAWFLAAGAMAASLWVGPPGGFPRPEPPMPAAPLPSPPTVKDQRQADFAGCLEEIEARIVRVRTLSKTRIDPKVPEGMVYEYTYGTGVFVDGEGTIATAFHLVRDRQKSLVGVEDVAILFRSSRSYIPVDVIAQDPINDVALLRVSPRALPQRKYFILRSAPPNPGERSYVVGLRAEAAADSFEVGIVGGTFVDAGLRMETLAGDRKLGPGPWITISQMILFGYSGGAILDGSGNLVGIVGGAPELKGKWVEFSYGTGIEAVLRLLTKGTEP